MAHNSGQWAIVNSRNQLGEVLQLLKIWLPDLSVTSSLVELIRALRQVSSKSRYVSRAYEDWPGGILLRSAGKLLQ
jgi:hypothetical protein